jgi:hypothetical protein
MPPADFDALVRTCRWSAVTPFVGDDGTDANVGLALSSTKPTT